MNDQTPAPRRSLLERADSQFDFGRQLRRLDPGALAGGPVLDAQAMRRKAAADAVQVAAPAPGQGAATAAIAPLTESTAMTAPAATVPHDGAQAAASVATPATAPFTPPANTPQPNTPQPNTPQPNTPQHGRRASDGGRAALTPVPPVPSRQRLVPAAATQVVDRGLLASNGLLDPDGNVGALAEEFRIIKRQLLRGIGKLPHGQRILVTSAQPDEGKTFSAINLALSLAAEQDLSVLLVDGDFARADVTRQLGLVPGLGLMNILADSSIDVARCIIPTDIPRLAVLPAGQATIHDTELLSSARMTELIATLDAGAPDRIILFDSMPLLAASSAGILSAHCGQVVVVVRADVTREAALRDAVGLIGQHNAIALLLNRVRFTPEGRRFGSYYGEEG